MDSTARTNEPFILASASPRRRQLLESAGYTFTVDPSDADEPPPEAGVSPVEYVARLAWLKARAVAARSSNGLVLGADTVCDLGGAILGKPVDRNDAERMLRRQEGQEFRVLTGLCLYRAGLEEWAGAVDLSVCRCRAFSDPERTAYLDSGLWQGKAGAYGVQDDDPFVEVVRGSWSNVVGLPLERLAGLLRAYPSLTARGPTG